MPTANTIIIDRADRFGLSQLHQLRGRVGRSHHQAYAYLFTPHHSALSADSKKRLDAIASLEELGSGFMLATHDMEIRGTGEILGEKQSGSIDTIGFTLFMDMLDRSIRSLKRGHEPKLDFHESDEIKIDLGASSLFPADYIPDVNIRLNLYKRLADLTTQPQLKDFSAELIDRFGALPIEATNLIKNNELKLKAKALKIHKINFNPVFIQIDFSDQPKIDSGKLIRLIQNQPHKYQLTSNNTLRIRSEGDNINDRINEFDQAIDKIRCNSDEQQSDSVAH